MEINLKANILINPELKTHIGNITIKNSEIVKFEKTENSNIIEIFNDKIFPIKRSEFEVQFLDKFDDEFKMFSALIKINDSLKVGVKLNYFEKIKLKWMLNKYLIQSKEIKIEILKYFITAILSFIGGIIYERIQIENKTPKIIPINEPKAGIKNSFDTKIIKTDLKKDTIIVK